ncbi:unnamed protein product [Callosobruchus maculatus]|uniref:Uncharacterized protein n=1 Tax=Callosobruchus maculatus TaxID=64391 RepID=A0A653C183_CALMS|nr:unnamed protein product [Callosobruchus maculatus]
MMECHDTVLSNSFEIAALVDPSCTASHSAILLEEALSGEPIMQALIVLVQIKHVFLVYLFFKSIVPNDVTRMANWHSREGEGSTDLEPNALPETQREETYDYISKTPTLAIRNFINFAVPREGGDGEIPEL